MKYTYHLDVYRIGTEPREERTLEPLEGEVQADRYSSACNQAWKEINPQLKGKDVTIGDLDVRTVK